MSQNTSSSVLVRWHGITTWYHFILTFVKSVKMTILTFLSCFFLFNVRYIGNYELSFNINFYQTSVGNVVEEAFGKQYTLKGKALSEPTANWLPVKKKRNLSHLKKASEFK